MASEGRASEPGPAIDLEHLGTYTQGDRDLERELLSMFLPSAKSYIDSMSAAAGGGAGHDWWTAAHSLKGVALGVGARELADLAASAEPLRDSGGGDRDDHIARLRAALERVRRFVADFG
jgi:HPt (histidine-containing phosphotransfer) domain-containing protein